MSLRTDPLIGMSQSIDDASKPYDGPIAFEKPMSRKDYVAIQAERRRRIDELYEKRAQQRSDVIDWNVIESFLGYGNINAPVVFVGMEEGLADPERLQDDLKYRSTFEPVMDVYEAHLGLAKGKKLFGERPRGQRTWRVMADVMLHFEGGLPATKEERAKARKEYRAKILGNKCAESLLLELLPYPHGNIKQWLYERFGATKREKSMRRNSPTNDWGCLERSSRATIERRSFATVTKTGMSLRKSSRKRRGGIEMATSCASSGKVRG